MASKEDLIRERAYDLWQQAGQPHGRSDEFWQLAWREVEADETGDDPVPIDEVPPNVDDIRTRTANIDRLTPSEATSATLQNSADRTKSDREKITRGEL